MASGSDVKAGGAYVELFVKGYRATQQQLASIGAGVTKLGAGIAAVGAGIVGPLAAAVNYFTSAGDALGKMSARTGVGVRALAELGFAAEQGGASIDDVEKGVRKMQRTIVDAGDGSLTAVEALDRIGLSAAKLRGLAPEDQFQAIADGLVGISDPTTQAATAMEIFGKSGTQLLPMLSTLREVREEARQRGLVPSEQAVKDAEAVNDAFNRIRRTGLAAFFELGAAIAPMLLPALEVVANIGTATIHWVKQNGALVRTIGLVGVGLVAVGTTIAAIGGGLVFVATVMGAVATLAAAVLSPVGLIVAGVVAIGAGLAAAVVYWVRFTSSGQLAFAALINAFRPFAKTLQAAFGGILDAIRGGNIELAFQVMTTGLKLLWLQFIDFATARFFDLARAIADNDLVKQFLPELAAKARNAATGSQAALRLEISRLTMELERLRAEAAKGVPAPKEAAVVKALGLDAELSTAAERKSVTAQTTAAALALTFGQRKPGDLTKEMLEELRLIRKHGIPAHRELLRQMRGFAPRVGA